MSTLKSQYIGLGVCFYKHYNASALRCVCTRKRLLTVDLTTSALRLHDAYTTSKNDHETVRWLASVEIHDVHDGKNDEKCPKNRKSTHDGRGVVNVVRLSANATLQTVSWLFAQDFQASCRRRVGVVQASWTFLGIIPNRPENAMIPRTYRFVRTHKIRRRPQTLAWLGSQEKSRQTKKTLDFSVKIGENYLIIPMSSTPIGYRQSCHTTSK